MEPALQHKRASHITGLVVRLLLGATFILSAAAKLWSVDQFELYIFSYGFLPLNLSFIAARLCIGAELALGILLLAGWWRRLSLTAAALLLLAFSIFLGYAVLAGRTDSCQCFGQMADMPPSVSLLKNAILLILTLLCIKFSTPEKRRRWHNWGAAAAIVAGLAIPFALSVPDSWMFGASSERYDEEALSQIIDGPLADKELRSGNKIMAFVTPGCPYCRMTRQKLEYIASRHHLPPDAIIYVEPSDIGANTFLKTTRGASPLILLMEDGTVTSTFHYRNIDERKIEKALR